MKNLTRILVLLALVLSFVIACGGEGETKKDAVADSGADAEADAGTDAGAVMFPDLPYVECDIEWEHTHEFEGARGGAVGKLLLLPNGHIVASGVASPEDSDAFGGYQGMVVEFDGDGNLLWNKLYGGDDDDRFNNIHKISDGYIMFGRTPEGSTNAAWAVAIDNEGNELWQKTLPGSKVRASLSLGDDQFLISTKWYDDNMFFKLDRFGDHQEYHDSALFTYGLESMAKLSNGNIATVGSVTKENPTLDFNLEDTVPYFAVLDENYASSPKSVGEFRFG